MVDQYYHKLDDRLIEQSCRYEKKSFQKMNSSDSQSYTDENREDISIDQSSECESYSKGSVGGQVSHTNWHPN